MKKIAFEKILLFILCTLIGCGCKSSNESSNTSPTKPVSNDIADMLDSDGLNDILDSDDIKDVLDSDDIKDILDSDDKKKEDEKKPENADKNENESKIVDVKGFQKVTILDNEQCSITITNVNPDDTWGYTLNVLLENKSPDKKYKFSVDNAAINGVQTEVYFSAEVAPGKKSNEDITFYNLELEDNISLDFSDITLYFRVCDADDWSSDDIAKITAHVYPLGKEHATTYVREDKPTDTVMVDNESFKLIVTGYETDDYGYHANLYLINKTDKPLRFDAEDVSVNGFMCNPFWYEIVENGNSSFSIMTCYDSDLEKNDITDVEEIEMNLIVRFEGEWDLDELYNEVVTLHP